MLLAPCGIWQGSCLWSSRRVELKRKLYRAVANVNIWKLFRFYVSFACSFAFGENKLMEGPLRFFLIARDEPTPGYQAQDILDKWSKGGDE